MWEMQAGKNSCRGGKWGRWRSWKKKKQKTTFNSLFCLDPDLKSFYAQISRKGEYSHSYTFSSDTKSLFPKMSELPICCPPPFKLEVRDNKYYNILLFLWIILQKPKSLVQLSQTSNSYLIFCLVCCSPLGQACQGRMSITSWKTTVGQRFRDFKNMIELISSYCN